MSKMSQSANAIMSLLRVGNICDFAEENWPSMGLVGDMLVRNLSQQHASIVRAERIRPPMARRVGRIPLVCNLSILTKERFGPR